MNKGIFFLVVSMLFLGACGKKKEDVGASGQKPSRTGTELNSDWTPQWETLLAYWKMNNNWEDSTGHIHAVAQGNMSFRPEGLLNSSGLFSGTSYLEVPKALELELGNQFTIQAWINAYEVQNSCLVSKFSQKRGWRLCMNTAGALIFEVGTRAFVGAALQSFNEVLEPKKWHHIVVSFQADTTQGRIYVDGVSRTSVANASPLPKRVNKNIFIGADVDTPQKFYGEMDEVALWTSTLSAYEVELLYSKQAK